MVLKFPYIFRGFQGVSWKKKGDFSVLANPSVVNRTVGIEAAKVLLTETNFLYNKFDTATSSVFNLFSLSAIMKLEFLFCLPVSRRFSKFKNRASRSLKCSRYFDRRISQTRFLIFVYLVLLDGVRYQLYQLNAKFRRNMLFYIFV